MITRKSFLKKALTTSIVFTSMTTAQNAIAATYPYDASSAIPSTLTLTNNDTVQFYTTTSGGHTAGSLTVPNIYGSGTLETYMGSGGNKINFGGYIGFEGTNTNIPNPLAFVSLIVGNGDSVANGGGAGDRIIISNPIKADKYLITSGNGGAGMGGGMGGGIGGGVTFKQVNIGSGGMDITAGIDGANNVGSAGSIDFGGDVIFYGASSNTSYIRAKSSNGTAATVNFSGNLQGVSANDTVLSLSSNARVFFSGAPLTVTGKVKSDSTGKLQVDFGTNITFTSDVIFQDSNDLGSIDLDASSSAIFLGNLTGAVTVGNNAAIILHDAPNMKFSGTIDGAAAAQGNLYTTNAKAAFDVTVGATGSLNIIGIGYSVDSNNVTDASPSVASFTENVSANSLVAFGGSSLSFTDAKVNLAEDLVLLNTNLTVTANNNDVNIAAAHFYVADGKAPFDISNSYVLTTKSTGAPSSITVTGKGSKHVTFPTSVIGKSTTLGNQPLTHPVGTVTFGTPRVGAAGDDVGVTVPAGLNVTTLNLGTTGVLILRDVNFLPSGSAHRDLVLNVNASNNPDSTIQIMLDRNATANVASATINLGANVLTANYTPLGGNIGGSSSINLQGDIDINTTFDGTNIGRIVVRGAGNAGISKLNIDPASHLNITLDSGGEVYQAPVEFYLFESQDNAQITPGATDQSVFTDINPNIIQPIKWSYDPVTYRISGSQGSVIVLPGNTSPNTVAILKALTTPPEGSDTLSTTQATILKQLGSAVTPEEAPVRIGAMEVTSASDQSNNEVNAMRSAAQQDRLALMPDYRGSDPSKFSQNNGGVAAGSNYEQVRGFWFTGFVQKVKQKQYSDTLGYKMVSRGGTLGADITISDKALVGVTWTNANSIMKQKNNIIINPTTSRSKVETNSFAFYAFTALPNNWFLQGDVSYGQSTTRKKVVRYDKSLIQPAHAKYKSYFYGADMQLIKRIERGNFLLQPTGGLAYNRFCDEAYAEYGGAQNWTVKDRSSYNIEALLGGRAMYSIAAKNDWILRPYLAAYSHITVKDKKGKIHSSIDGLINVDFQSAKTSPAWYSTGAGVYAYKGDGFEIAATWEGQFDKKYRGNIGTLKVRVEF